MSTESTLWMGDIQPWMNEEIIMKAFIECGLKPMSIKTIKDKKLNILRNYCFINFSSEILCKNKTKKHRKIQCSVICG